MSLGEAMTDVSSFIRFWEKVDERSAEECWVWRTGKNDQQGYGSFWVGGRNVLSHRVAWTIANGPIPEGLYVLHRCDNPPCVNPAHLFVGDGATNMEDMSRKGRQGNTRLTWDDVREMRRLYREERRSPISIARDYRLAKSTVSYILNEKTWREDSTTAPTYTTSTGEGVSYA